MLNGRLLQPGEKVPVSLPPIIPPGGYVIGVGKKPTPCASCAYHTVGTGFVPDECPENPKIALLLETPSLSDATECRPMSGRAGYVQLKRLFYVNGIKREDLLICHTLRCGNREGKYPTAKIRADAEARCRQYDDKLVAFDPTVLLVTVHPGMLLRSSAMLRLVQGDIRKALEFAENGERPLVLMGDKAMNLVAPWLTGGVKGWRGNFWYGRYGTKYDG